MHIPWERDPQRNKRIVGELGEGNTCAMCHQIKIAYTSTIIRCCQGEECLLQLASWGRETQELAGRRLICQAGGQARSSRDTRSPTAGMPGAPDLLPSLSLSPSLHKVAHGWFPSQRAYTQPIPTWSTEAQSIPTQFWRVPLDFNTTPPTWFPVRFHIQASSIRNKFRAPAQCHSTPR